MISSVTVAVNHVSAEALTTGQMISSELIVYQQRYVTVAVSHASAEALTTEQMISNRTNSQVISSVP
jgi:hypothetical protein